MLSIFIIVFSFAICGQNGTDKDSVFSQKENILERTNSHVDWKNTNFSYAVRDIFWTTQIPWGISVAFENNIEDEIKINKKPDSFVVKDLLNEAIKYDSRYQWTKKNGVVNVSPKNDYPVMDIRIAEFKIDILYPKSRVPITNDTKFPKLNELEKKIIETKEFQAYIKERNLLVRIPNSGKYGFLCCGFIGKPMQTKISIDLKNATVREILNEIVRQKGFGWTYREFNIIDEGKLYHIFRLKI